MKFRFKARIYKVGINPCVKVPRNVTDKMTPKRGYIPVKGEIDSHKFEQTLVAVKGEPYRLYVNGLMLKGSGARVGETAQFTIEQTTAKRKLPGDCFFSLKASIHLSSERSVTSSGTVLFAI